MSRHKKERARLIEARTAEEQAAFRAAMPFGREELEQLLDHLSREPALSGEDPLAQTRAWLAARGFPVEPAVEALASRDLRSDAQLLEGANPYQLFGPTPRRLAWMPIERGDFEALMARLDQLGDLDVSCDGSQRHTGAWLADQGLPVRETLAALRALGGHCDCEVSGVEVEWIYPPKPSLVVAPPPPRPRSREPRPTEYRDEVLGLALPRKPWYLRPASREAPLVLQFGKGFRMPELRIRVEERPADEGAWCRERWHAAHLEQEVFWAGRSRQDAVDSVAENWTKFQRRIAGPEAAEPAALRARWYFARAQGQPTDAAWCLLESPRGFRVVELFASAGAWESAPFWREAQQLVARFQVS